MEIRVLYEINTAQLLSYGDRSFMTRSDVTMNDMPLCEALPAESISARAMSLLQIERICNHTQKPESY